MNSAANVLFSPEWWLEAASCRAHGFLVEISLVGPLFS